MYREMYEQPDALAETLARYVGPDGLRDEAFDNASAWLAAGNIMIAASGSSRHAGLAAEIMIEDLSGIPVDVEYASEYATRSTHPNLNPAVAVISQSGETADTLAALRKALEMHLRTLAITNVAASSMAREAAVSLPTMAGKELAIPATKSFTCQLLVLYLLALFAARQRGTISSAALSLRLAELARLPESIAAQVAGWEAAAAAIAGALTEAETFLYLGRGVHYAIAREGALKLKESSYVQAEGYPAGELKHGPNALVSPAAPLVVLATVDREDSESILRYTKTLQLLEDMKRQGATIVAVINRGDATARALATHAIEVDAASEYVLPICEVIPLQLFAYFIAIGRGVDVDRPRNLVKAVVVE
jgi:glucosamine--fructose-6-phosphate aminotransferase (isomerizing)